MAAGSLSKLLELDRPLAFIDAASTGLDVRNARIVRLAVLKIGTDGKERFRTALVNPGTAIPPGATQVHGITDDDVQDAPSFAAYARGLAEHLADCDLAGFGIKRFHAPLLAAEFRRADVEFDLRGRVIVDAMLIFHRLEPRDLRAAYRRFTGDEMPDLQEPDTAVRAAVEVLAGEISANPDLPRSPAHLAGWAEGIDENAADPEGKFVWAPSGDLLINFGKHRGRRLADVARAEPDYLEWIARSGEFGAESKRLAEEALAGKYPARPEA